MAENSSIAWTDDTWNPWRGCTKVSPACANCYAEVLSLRYGMPPYQKGIPRKRLSEDNWKKPYKWNKKPLICDRCGNAESNLHRGVEPICGNCGGSMHRRRVFSLSLGDWLDDEVDIQWLADMLKVIHETPNLDWLLLTKRPENWSKRIDAVCKLWACDGSYMVTPEARAYHEMLCPWRSGFFAPRNVRIGITAENQTQWDLRLPHFLNIPARSRFVSIEPMLSGIEMNLEGTVAGKFKPAYMMIDQIIVGGESGSDHKNRMLNLEAVASIYAQCRQWGVKYFMKQDSGPLPGMRGRIPDALWVQEFPG